MSAYFRYWLITATLISLVLVGWEYGFFNWALEHFGDPKIKIAAFFLIGIFLYAYLMAHKVALQLYRDDKILRRNIEGFLSVSDSTKAGAVEKMFIEFHAHAGDRALINSSIGRAVKSLANRIGIMRQVDTFEPINRSMFQDYFEADLTRGLTVLEKFQWILFNVGFLGTLVGIVLALALQSAPVSVEETKVFVFGIISGAGLAYTTSALGIGGGLILFVLIALLDGCATDIASRFRNKMFEVVFPVIHSERFGYHENARRRGNDETEEK